MGRYDGKQGAELYREYAKAAREDAQRNPDFKNSRLDNARDWERVARRAEKEGK